MINEEFLLATPNLHEKKLINEELMRTLHSKALTHTSREAVPEIFKTRRPNETNEQYEYRLKNYRRLSHELYEQFLSKSTRSIRGGGFRLSYASELLKANLEKKNIFQVSNSWVDWKEYFASTVLPKSLVNPNQLFFLFPTDPLSEEINPYFDTPKNIEIKLNPIFVNYDSVRWLSNSVFIFDSGLMAEADTNGTLRPILWGHDSDYWYKLMPFIKKDDDGFLRTYYEAIPWYQHSFGHIPYNWLVGRSKNDDQDDEYKESLLVTAFEHLDEAICSISDDQAVRTIAAYPHIVMGQLDCEECSGHGTKKGETCSSCSGTGHRKKQGILDAWVVPPETMNEQSSQLSPFIQFASPDVGIVKHMHDIAFGTFYRNAFRVVGLKPFTDVTESGEAKKHRLEDLQDILRDMTMSAKVFCERMHYVMELYFKNGASSTNIEEPIIRMPKTFLVDDIDILSDRYSKVTGFAKEQTQNQIYFVSKGESPTTEAILKFAHLYAPLLSDSEAQMQFKVQNLVYSVQDLVRADYAIRAFEELSERPDFLTWDFTKAKDEAEALLVSWGVIVNEL